MTQSLANLKYTQEHAAEDKPTPSRDEPHAKLSDAPPDDANGQPGARANPS